MTAMPRSSYTSQFASHRASFVGAVSSEFRKLMVRSILITTFIGVLLSSGLALIFVYAAHQKPGTPTNAEGVLDIWSIPGLVMIVVGALCVTSEYAHNTMRTTALSEAKRALAFFAKVVASAIYTAIYALITVTVLFGITFLQLGSQAKFTAQTWYACGRFVAVLVAFALITLGLGYVLRSTAGAIALVMVFFVFGGMIGLIPVEWVAENIPQFMPQGVGTLAITNETMPPFIGGPLLDSAADAFAALGAYVAVSLAGGFVMFTQRDI
ncbi:ABC transporter permease [Arcanobacterium canis]